jgi:glutamine amidotransferase PdxT
MYNFSQESTAMAIIAERTGMFSALREYIDQGKPVKNPTALKESCSS